MIVVDTNVLSEMMRTAPDPTVRSWFRDQRARDLYVTTITEAEIWLGIELLSDGRRRQALEQVARTALNHDFAGRKLNFDSQSAEIYGTIAAGLMRRGRPVGIADLQIAAIARVHGFAIATRNTRHFADCGVALIDPFTPAASQ